MHIRDAGRSLNSSRPSRGVRDRRGDHWILHGRPYLADRAGRYPDRIAAAASFHGGMLPSTTIPQPHLLPTGSTPRHVAAAENDSHFPPEEFERLEQVFTAAGSGHHATYPAAHGFAVPDNSTYDAAAPERIGWPDRPVRENLT